MHVLFLFPLMFFFFFNDTATTEIYTLSLHDALPICWRCCDRQPSRSCSRWTSGQSQSQMTRMTAGRRGWWRCSRSEEHTSELQSRQYLVCRLLLEKKKL